MAQRRSSTKKGKKITLVSAIAAVLVAVAWLFLACSETFGWDLPPALSDAVALLTGEDGPSPVPDGECRVHFIDVGQGDSILIQADGQNALIDAGENNQGKTVVDYLNSLGVEKIDLLMMTHPHSDHIGGMDNVIKSFEIKKIVMPRLSEHMVPTTRTYTEVLEAIAEKGLKITASKPGMELSLGEGAFTILGPVQDYSELNNTSLVCRFDYGDSSFLFTGDEEADAERDVLNSGAEVSADVLKLGHHGSRTSTSKIFFEAVNPSFCVIEVGDDNDYGHPHKETLKTLVSGDADVYRTDFQGTVVFSIRDGTFSINCEKGDLR